MSRRRRKVAEGEREMIDDNQWLLKETKYKNFVLVFVNDDDGDDCSN